MKTFNYDIVIEAIVPPVGEPLKFVAMAAYLYENDDGKQLAFPHRLGKCGPRREMKGAANHKTQLDKWIATQNLVAGNAPGQCGAGAWVVGYSSSSVGVVLAIELREMSRCLESSWQRLC